MADSPNCESSQHGCKVLPCWRSVISECSCNILIIYAEQVFQGLDGFQVDRQDEFTISIQDVGLYFKPGVKFITK